MEQKIQTFSKELVKKTIQVAENGIALLKSEIPLSEERNIGFCLGERPGNMIRLRTTLDSVKVIGKISLTPSETRFNDIDFHEVNANFELLICFYFCRYDWNDRLMDRGWTKVRSDTIEIKDQGKTISFKNTHYRDNINPIHFTFAKKEDFLKVKKMLKNLYREFGLKQKGIFIKESIKK